MTRSHAPARLPTQHEETRLRNQGFRMVAGVDEVGRGPLAGPVVAAAVVLPPLHDNNHRDLPLIRDSKQLTPAQRQRAAALVESVSLGIGVGMASSQEIDRVGIVAATEQAMGLALENLPVPPDYLLIDALPLTWRGLPCTAIIHGDGLCTAISAASVVAKVYRDGLMAELDGRYPGYGFASHKGYASPTHLAALKDLGPSPIHRRSFSPLRPHEPKLPALRRALLGTSSERIAEAYLVSKGFEILDRNFRTRYGEVDLITRHDGSIVFVEVRTRRSHAAGRPEETLPPRKQQRLVATAQQYLQDRQMNQIPWRIDLVAISTTSGAPEVGHYPAVQLEEPHLF
jgi:ribonuclease HII